MTKLRILLFAVFIVIVAVLIVFPYRNKAPIKIAFLGNLSGSGSASEIAACKGAMLAVEAVNTRGGSKGRRVELSLYDHKGQAGNVSGSCRAMAGKNISLVIAPFVHEGLLAPCTVKVQILCTMAGPEKGRPAEDPPCIGLHFRSEDYGRALADLALGRGINTMAVLYDTFYYPYGQALLQGFSSRYLEGGGEMRAELRFDCRYEENFQGLASDIAGHLPQGLLVISSGKATGQLGAMVRRDLPMTALFAAPWAMNEDLLVFGNSGVEGACGHLTDASTERQSGALRSFLDEYRSRYGKPADLSALFGYESLQVLAEGLRNSASPDPFLVRHTLIKLHRFKGLISDYYISREDLPTGSFVLGQVKSGRIAPVE